MGLKGQASMSPGGIFSGIRDYIFKRWASGTTDADKELCGSLARYANSRFSNRLAYLPLTPGALSEDIIKARRDGNYEFENTLNSLCEASAGVDETARKAMKYVTRKLRKAAEQK